MNSKAHHLSEMLHISVHSIIKQLWSGVISLYAVAAKLGHFRSERVKGPKMRARCSHIEICTERLIANGADKYTAAVMM